MYGADCTQHGGNYQPDEEMVALAVEHEILIALEALIRIDAE